MASRQSHGPPGAPGREAVWERVSEFFHILSLPHLVGLRLQGRLDWGLMTQVLKWQVLGPWDHQGLQRGLGVSVCSLAC